MRMPWEAGAIVVRIIIAEIVKQEKRVELLGIAEAKGAL
jgi:hypothetical protein